MVPGIFMYTMFVQTCIFDVMVYILDFITLYIFREIFMAINIHIALVISKHKIRKFYVWNVFKRIMYVL